MAEELLLEAEFESASNPLCGFSHIITPAPFVLEIGAEYRAVFDGVEYPCTGLDASPLGTGAVGIGNGAAFGLPGSGEPFCFGTFGGAAIVVCPFDTEPTQHSITLYKTVKESGLVTESYDGSQIVHPGVESVSLYNTDGDIETFVHESLVAEPVEATVDVDWSGGDMIVTPEVGKVFSSVSIPVPSNLRPAVIAEGEYIAGVGPGTHKGGSGAGGTTGGASIIPEPEWIDDVCFWDYDGTLILHLPVDEARKITELPSVPVHDGLTFLGWNYTLEQVQVTEYPLDIGAMYIPTDGKTHLHLDGTGLSSMKVTLNWSQTVSGGVAIDWGDGTATTTVAGTEAVTATHTYSAIGEYDVAITVADGCVMTLGGGTSSTTFGNITYITGLYIGRNVVLGDYGLAGISGLSTLTIPNTIGSIPKYGVNNLALLRALIIPNSVTTIAERGIYSIGGYSIRCDNAVISMPESIDTIDKYVCCGSAGALRLSIPKTVTVLPGYMVYNLYRALRVFMSNNVTDLGSYNGYNCYHLRQLKLPDALETIGDNCLNGAYSLEALKLPRGLKTIGKYVLYNVGIADLFVPASVESIGSNSLWYSCNALRRIVFEGTVTPPYNSSVYGLHEIFYLSETPPESVRAGTYYTEIYVPDSAFDAYYAKVGADYKFRVHKLSEYPGELPSYG